MKSVAPLLYRIMFTCAGIIILFAILYKAGYKPLYTDSVSFDTKIDYANVKAPKKIKIIAVGSSMSLNNLNSQTFIEAGDSSYFNFSAWGLQIIDTKHLLLNILQNHECKYVIICSSITDFMHNENKSITRYCKLNSFLRQHLPAISYYHNFNPIYQIMGRKSDRDKLVNDTVNRGRLKFDDYGGAPLNVTKKHLYDTGPFVKAIFPTINTNANYEALDETGRLLNSLHIKLIFVQPPIRSTYLNQKGSALILSKHTSICKAIVEKYNGVYVNISNPEIFTDSLFVDEFHLQETGAKLFTRMLIDKTNMLFK